MTGATTPADISRAISTLEAALAALERRAEAEATVLRERADQAENRADRAEQALATQRDRVEGLLAQLATVAADAKGANVRAWASGEAVGALREQLAALEQRSEAGRVRADRADSSATHEREDFLDAESRTQRELAAVRKRLEQAERVAEQARRELQESGKAQSQAEAARQGKGRLARLLAAWRGSDAEIE
jgi:DNA repair exonuclease SbcCD ATPase subunit